MKDVTLTPPLAPGRQPGSHPHSCILEPKLHERSEPEQGKAGAGPALTVNITSAHKEPQKAAGQALNSLLPMKWNRMVP